MSSETPIDPIRFEVIRNALVEATEEMASASAAERVFDEYQDAARFFLRYLRSAS